jgi:hypothetical protein
MDRRKAIFRICLTGAGITAAATGYHWWDITKSPHLTYLLHNRGLIDELAETIIPATDTPGAKDAEVGDFIIKMVSDCTDKKSQNKFINGLSDLKSYCRDRHNKPFEQCNDAQKEEVLRYFEKDGKPFSGFFGKVQRKLLGKSFFVTLKEYTVEGYCTSRAGATSALVYVPVPGKFDGCTVLQPGQNAWATN